MQLPYLWRGEDGDMERRGGDLGGSMTSWEPAEAPPLSPIDPQVALNDHFNVINRG